VRNERLLLWSTAFSLALVALGISSAAVEIAKARRKKEEGTVEFVSPRRTIRRLFTSLVLMALGLMIFLGVHFLEFSPVEMKFFVYWGVIFLLVVWLFLCPFFDLSETQRVYRMRMKNLADQTMEQLKMKNSHGSKGSGPPSGRGTGGAAGEVAGQLQD
jgi:Mn2+/Fe2+ NRAMP family transporter